MVNEIEGLGGVARMIAADVSDNASVENMIATVTDEGRKIKYLVNNAGITKQLPFDDLAAIQDQVWEELYAVNVKGAFNCARAAAPHLRLSAGASIVNVGSIAGETGYGSSIPYAVSKAALHGLTKSLARALAPHIRVNCVAPGAVQTRWWAGNEEKMYALSGALPLKRISSPEDIAETDVMLLEGASITGQILKVENGMTL